MPTITDALAGARYQAPVKQPLPTVLIAGAASRLGERILARLLGTREYQRIYVLASDSMRSTENRLCAVTRDDWTTRVDHVIAIVDSGDHAIPGNIARKRTDVFSSLFDDDVLDLAKHAASLGVSRFMLVTPMNTLSQPGAFHAQLSNMMEVELHRMQFESILLVRPSDNEMRLRNRGISSRFWNVLVNTAAGLMVGARHVPLSLDQTARAIVTAMHTSQQGLTIIEMDRLHQLLKPQATLQL